MTQYSVDFTARYKVHYKSNTLNHAMIFRYGATSGAPSGTIISGVTAFLDAIEQYLPTDFAVLSAEYAPQGVNFFLPATAPATPDTTGNTAPDRRTAPNFITFTGKSVQAAPWRISVIGVSPGQTSTTILNDYRVTRAEDAAIDGGLDALSVLAAAGMTAIDSQDLIFNGYANFGVNAHIQRYLRTH